ncbi:MAG: antiviral reverse transcriptase Drt3b [Thiolinea sp.]
MEVRTPGRVKLDKKDYFRALLTDTSPSDVPIVFSNDGFYINSHRMQKKTNSDLSEIVSLLYNNIIDFRENDDFSDEEKQKEQKKQSYPLKYKIIKNETSLRTLSLLHPRAQLNFLLLYESNSDLILNLCSHSNFSIRSPQKIGSSYYLHDVDDNKKYKEVAIDTLEYELRRRHASSFFTYKGYDRIYKLFNDVRYLILEKKFSCLHFLDVANCFDSIYTHSISWAVKNKEFIKDHIDFKNQFCQIFDTYMQRSNNNETNGIPVGSEVSRIFAEIIFQAIDVNIEKTLYENHNFEYGKDYVVMRYVDDYIVFSRNIREAKYITDAISDSLNNYNLYLGQNKIKSYNRPFCTEKSSIIIEVEEVIKSFQSKLYLSDDEQGKKIIKLNKINKKQKIYQDFVSRIKKICIDNNSGYGEVSSYLISVFSKRLLRLLANVEKKEIQFNYDSDDVLNLRHISSLFLELMFFFYTVHPSVPSSNVLAKTIIITDDFFVNNYSRFAGFIRTEIMRNIASLSFDENIGTYRHGYISLEKLNIVLSTSKFGRNYLLPADRFKEMLDNNKAITYFDIISLLYYFQDHEIYKDLRFSLETIIREKLLDKKIKPSQNSENAHLILDITTCPYVSDELKENILVSFFCEINKSKTIDEIRIYVNALKDTFWFVKWKNLDLVKLLERKELTSVY